jgi:hypothetical protein
VTKLVGAKCKRVMRALRDGEWHAQYDLVVLPYISWGTIAPMLQAGLIESRKCSTGTEYRIVAETNSDFGDLWVE